MFTANAGYAQSVNVDFGIGRSDIAQKLHSAVLIGCKFQAETVADTNRMGTLTPSGDNPIRNLAPPVHDDSNTHTHTHTTSESTRTDGRTAGNKIFGDENTDKLANLCLPPMRGA